MPKKTTPAPTAITKKNSPKTARAVKAPAKALKAQVQSKQVVPKKTASIPVFKKNHRVTWKSQARGTQVSKTGTIVEVVANGRTPESRPKIHGIPAFSRKGESYFVKVPGATKKQDTYYWPRVKHLTKAEPVTESVTATITK